MAADLQAQVHRAPHAQYGAHCGQHFDAHPSSTIFAPGRRNLRTQAVQPFGQTVASDRRLFRPDRRFRTAQRIQRRAISNNPPLRAACRGRPLGQIVVFWRPAVSAGAPHTASANTHPPDGYSKRPSRTRPAAASNSRAVEAKASRRLVTSVARGSESSAIQTDSTPPRVAAKRAERSSNSAKSPS